VDFDPATSELPVANVVAQLSERTRVVAVTAASNLIGTMPDVRAIAERSHGAGALVCVDGVRYTTHGGVVAGKRDVLAGMTGETGARRDRIVASLGAFEHYEDTLRTQIEQGLRRLPGVSVHSMAARRTPTLLVTFAERTAAAISAALARRGLGLGAAGGLRIGLAPYNTADDVDRLLHTLAAHWIDDI
jgi:selenocysteine lyase/cysteine desulfurase